MSEILQLLSEILRGNLPSIKLVFLFSISFCIYKILGKYIEFYWFKWFPLTDMKSQFAILNRELNNEISRHRDTQRIAEIALKRCDDLEARLMLLSLSNSQTSEDATEVRDDTESPTRKK